MKRTAHYLMSLLLLVPCLMLFTACGGTLELKGIALKNSDNKYTVVQNEEFDTSKIVVVATYEDGSTKDILAKDLEFSALDTSTIGDKVLTITYNSKTTTITIKVVSDISLTYKIMGFDKPQFVVDYNNNIKTQSTEKSDYLIKDRGYYVGTDNPFHFMPDITALDENNNLVEVNKYLSVSTVFEKQGSEYNELKEEALTSMVAIDEENNTFDFTDAAVDKIFKISVHPFNLSDDQMENVASWTQSFEFKVVKGWNVENIAEFSRFDNSTENVEKWREYKTANNIGNEKFDAMIIHGNLKVTKNDIPKSFFYNDGDTDLKTTDSDYAIAKGSFRDQQAIYNRYVSENDKFTLIGNYFTVDASTMPLTVRDDGEIVTNMATLVANTTLLSVGGSADYGCAQPKSGENMIGEASFQNMKFIGNATIDNPEEVVKYTGSISLVHTKSKLFENTNVITQTFKTTYFSMADIELNYCKGYDTFNANVHLYLYDSPAVQHNAINNSVFKRSSGPLFMISQTMGDRKNPDSFAPTMNINDCTLENWISAQDPWFAMNIDDPTMVTQLLSMDYFFKQSSKNVLGYEKGYTKDNSNVNFISVVKGSGAAGANKGVLDFSKTIGSELKAYATTNMEFIKTNVPAAYNGAPAFTTSLGGMALCDGKKLITLSPADADLKKLLSDDYLTIYTPAAGSEKLRMGIVLEYYKANA